MPPKKNSVDIVAMAENASREYVDASDRMLTLVERLGDSHAKLLQSRRQRDELLLSAVTAWHLLGQNEQKRLSAVLGVVNHPAAEKLLASIQSQRPVQATGDVGNSSPVSDRRQDEKTSQ